MKAKMFLLALPAALALGALATAGDVQQLCMPANQNSTGRPALLTVTGSRSLWQNDTCLHVYNVPANSGGVFFFGRDRQDSKPFYAGILCIGTNAKVYRMAAAVADSNCCVGCDMDLGTYPATVIQPGDTWYFQYLFADNVWGERNTSNALAITFVR